MMISLKQYSIVTFALGFMALPPLPAFAQSARDLLVDAAIATRSGDQVKALSLYEASAKLGSKSAQLFTAQLYKNGGDGITVDHKKARYWYEQAALQGDRIASVYLGEMLEAGQGGPVDNNAALYWYKKAAADGSSKGQEKADALIAKLDNFNSGRVKADGFYDASSKVKDKSASEAPTTPMPKVTNRLNFDSQKSRLYRGLQAVKSGSYDDALVLLLPLADKGIVKAQVAIGDIYSSYKFTDEGRADYVKAAKYYQSAASQNDHSALLSLAEMYLEEDIPAPKPNAGVEILKQLVKNRDAKLDIRKAAHDALGYMYQEGFGVPKSDKKALQHKLSAVTDNIGLEEAKEIAKLIENGIGTKASPLGAIPWYAKAAMQGDKESFDKVKFYADQGDASAAYVVGFALRGKSYGMGYSDLGGVKKDPEAALRYIQQGANGDYAPALLHMAGEYNSGRNIEKSPQKAFEYTRRAALKTHTDTETRIQAHLDLATHYYRGYAVEQSYAKAISNLDIAAALGSKTAAMRLAEMHLTGTGTPKFLSKATDIYEYLAEKGDGEGLRILADHYAEGKGVPEDLPKAVTYYERAALLGDAQAQNNIGIMFIGSDFVDENLEAAMFWFTQSSNSGNQQGLILKLSLEETIAQMKTKPQ